MTEATHNPALFDGLAARKIRVRRDAVYVYRSGDEIHFRRSDHRPPKGLGVEHVAGIVWSETDGMPQAVTMFGHDLDEATIADALAWGRANRPPSTSPLTLVPHQERVFQDLIAEDEAMLVHTVGTGAIVVAVAAAARRALNANAKAVHVHAAPALRTVTLDLFIKAFNFVDNGTSQLIQERTVPEVRFTHTADGVDEIANSADILLIGQNYPGRYSAAFKAALKRMRDRDGVIYRQVDLPFGKPTLAVYRGLGPDLTA